MTTLEQLNGEDYSGAAGVAKLLREWADVLDIPSGCFVNEDLRKAAGWVEGLAAAVTKVTQERDEALALTSKLNSNDQLQLLMEMNNKFLVRAITAEAHRNVFEGTLRQLRKAAFDRCDWSTFQELRRAIDSALEISQAEAGK